MNDFTIIKQIVSKNRFKCANLRLLKKLWNKRKKIDLTSVKLDIIYWMKQIVQILKFVYDFNFKYETLHEHF